MKRKIRNLKRLQRIFLISSLTTLGFSEILFHQSQSQVIWKATDSPEGEQTPLIQKTFIELETTDTSKVEWEIVPEGEEERTQPNTNLIWELLESEVDPAIHKSGTASDQLVTTPSNLEEAEALFQTIPLQSSDFKALINHSHAVPTASVVGQDEWRLISTTISPFNYASGTGNQNYAIQFDYGLSNTLQISGFYSEADDPLNSLITGLDIRPGNFWEVFGAASRWKFLKKENWSLAVNSSIESWTVGSGGSDSLDNNSGDNASPNIFNNSGKRVETQNLIGSISFPLTWHPNKKWQFTFNPGISFLPSRQGEGQGGAGKFYGTIPYIGGGILWNAITGIGVTASVAQPIGSGANSFDENLEYSRVPIFSGGVNWHINPRIALQGQLTNGFGATPATGILALPSDNRLGYSAKILITTDAADTPQPPLSSRQNSLSLGGLTVNTALVPPDTNIIAKTNYDVYGNFDALLGYSISNIFQLDFYRSQSQGIPQGTKQARTYLNDDGINLRGSGKAVLTSPLRGAPIWSALRISFGRNMDTTNNSAQGYLFAETPLTWEMTPKIAINMNPKVAWAGVGTLWGLGVGSNVQLAQDWELISEAVIVLNSKKESNGTLGLRWNASQDIAIEIYGSTASSITDVGQLLNAKEIRWGGRLILRL